MNDRDITTTENADSRRTGRFATAMIAVFSARLGIAAFQGLPDLSPGFSMDSGAPELICLLWPILLGVLILRLRWPSLMAAAAITMLVLVVRHAMGAGLGVMAYLDATAVSTPAWLRFTRAFELGQNGGNAAGRFAIRVGSFLIDAALMVAAILPAIRSRRLSAGFSRSNRRSVGARMAILGSMVFAFLSLGTLAWDTYIHALAFSPRLRQLVLRDDTRGQASPAGPGASNFGWRPGRLLQLVHGSMRHVQDGDVAAARKSARNALRQIKLATDRRMSDEMQRDRAMIAMALNNLAWQFATGAASDQEPELAVDLARESVRLAPGEGTAWNTLGVALLRASADREAEQAFRRSLELRNGGDSFDWLFLAILRQRAGKTDEARALYKQSIEWDASHRPNDPELRRFEDEAAGELGLPSPSQSGASAPTSND